MMPTTSAGSSFSVVVTHNHTAVSSDEISLRVGDVINYEGNHWDGWSMGTIQRTKKVGLFPSYNVKDVVNVADMPVYHDRK